MRMFTPAYKVQPSIYTLRDGRSRQLGSVRLALQGGHLDLHLQD